MPDLTRGVRAAIKQFKNKAALAEALGISRSAITQWDRVPVTRVLQIEKLSGGEVTRHQMRPDIYGPEQRAA